MSQIAGLPISPVYLIFGSIVSYITVSIINNIMINHNANDNNNSIDINKIRYFFFNFFYLFIFWKLKGSGNQVRLQWHLISSLVTQHLWSHLCVNTFHKATTLSLSSSEQQWVNILRNIHKEKEILWTLLLLHTMYV